METRMKFLVVGLGSMGKRRVRCLQALKVESVVGFDPREDRRTEAKEKYSIPTFAKIEEALASGVDALVISTPPDLHMIYAKMAVEHGKHFFCEASVTDHGMAEVMSMLKDKSIVAAPSCTMRFHPAIKIIKELVDKKSIGKLEAFSAHAGQWLPDWHPWEDYRTYYVSKRDTGACREIVPFELTWLTWVLGNFQQVAGMRGKVSELDCDIDDIYQLLLRSKDGLYGHLMVDVLARYPNRSLRLIGSEGTIEWVADTKEVRLFTVESGKWQSFKEATSKVEAGYSYLSAEGMYIEEMQAYADACAGKKPFPMTMEDDHRVLETLYASEKSNDSGTFQKLG
jgi:predicted dehydrogenase